MNAKSLTYVYCPAFLRPALDRSLDSSLGSRLVRGVFWSVVGVVISRGLMLFALVLVARILGKSAFGELGMIRSTVGMFGVFAGFGLGLTATKHVAEFRISDPHRTGRIIGLSGVFAAVTGGLMALGLLVIAPFLAERTINAPHLTGVLRVGALIIFMDALNGAQIGALSGFEAFKTITAVNLFVGLLSFPVLICGAYFGGLAGAVWALAINLAFNWLLNHLALRKEAIRNNVTLAYRGWSRELSVLWRFSLPAVLGGVLVGPVRWACNALLVSRPDGYAEMGTFAAALVFQNLLLFASGMLNTPMLSMLSSAGTNVSNKLGAVNILSSWIPITLIAIFLLSLPETAGWVFGKEYQGQTLKIVLVITLFHTWLLALRSGLGRILAARNLLWWSFFSNSAWGVMSLLSALFLVGYGAIGLAASFALAHVIISVVVIPFYLSRRLAPAVIFFSKEAAMVWLVVVGLAFSSVLNAPVGARLIAMPVALLIAGWAFGRMWKLIAEDSPQ